MRRIHLLPGTLAFALALTLGLPALAEKPAEKPAKETKAEAGKTLATVNGKAITESEVEKAAAADLTQLEREYEKARHTVIENRLRQVVEDSMLDAEAKARGVSKDQLIAEAGKGATAPVTDAEIDKFYEENRGQIPPNIPKEQVLPQIKSYLEQQRQAEARKAFYATLATKYKAEYRLEPLRVPVDAATYTVPTKGPATAPVTIVEFSDFQCPVCARLKPTLDQIKEKYGDKVRIVFRQYPLTSIHPNAPKAAEAALCANDQGKFWELHDAMFADQAGLAMENLKAKATKIAGLKPESFNACLDSGKHAEEVRQDLASGTAAGVGSTPSMFINGRSIVGLVPFEEISKIVDDELQRSDRSHRTSTGM